MTPLNAALDEWLQRHRDPVPAISVTPARERYMHSTNPFTLHEEIAALEAEIETELRRL